ncbi:MAG: carboxypeptidase regulatory-like domain-containing protein, partial [Vicinamibacteria bacterium]|nr:carboxypeptidase regulatory-like domain-containing protein [Vicinamibacteria bacterium]
MPATRAEAQFRKIGEMELRLSGMSASIENAEPVVPKNTPGGVRILVRAGGVDLSLADLFRFLGRDFSVQGELSGPGLSQPVSLPFLQPGEELPADPLILPTPPIAIAGNYRLSNLRIVSGGRTVLDVEPSSVPLKVIDQILVTQVTTRALTLDEIRGKGIVLDSDDYLGFEFTMGFKLDSKAVDLKFPVVFDRQGVAIPQPLSPPPAPTREGISLPTILPLLLQAEDANGEPVEIPKVTMPSGAVKPVTIPAVLVIPGNVGYLKQFFSAQLYVSNGAPVGSKLNVRDIKARLKLPPGVDLELGTTDDPLALPELERDGRVITQPLEADVRGIGADGVAGTGDDVAELAPAEQGQVEFLIRGEKEGFHQINFDLTAQLLGLPIGPVTVKGKAAGGVLVRNPYFNVTFSVPSVARAREPFVVRATVTNIGKGIANSVSMNLDQDAYSNLTLKSEPSMTIHTLKPGDSKVLEFSFESLKTGKVVATYLKMDGGGSTGDIKFRVGIGERNVPLSPDTLVLPASTEDLPEAVADAAMRVLGQAWSVANAPSGTLPAGVIRVSGQTAVKKALALAEAGLRVTLGQARDAAVRDLFYDFFSGEPVDPGFDQLLRTTEAGHAFVQAVGANLSDAALQTGGGTGYEYDTARLIASAAPFTSFGWDGVEGDLALVDGAGRTSIRSTSLGAPAVLTSQNVVGAVLMPLGSDIMLGLATQPSAGPYRWEFRASQGGTGSLSTTFPRPDGSFGRASWSGPVSEGSIVRVLADGNGEATLQVDQNGDGVFESTNPLSVNTLPADGPRLVAGAIIGPETLDGAGPWGFQTVLVFDRVVGEGSAAQVSNYSIPDNKVRSARRQLSGRLVFAALALPEGPYLPARLTVRGIEDTRGAVGPEGTVTLASRLNFSRPGSPASPEMGAIVSGRVLDSDGSPLAGRTVTYAQFPSLLCTDVVPFAGFAAPTTDQNGAFELRYVRQDQCGNPFQLFTIDPSSGARRSQSLYVRSPGQQIVADFVMLATGSVNGTVRDFQNKPIAGAKVTVLSQTETQVGAATVTDSLGRYSVSGVTVGPVTVRAGKGNGIGSAAGRIDRANVPAQIDVTIFDGAARAHGTVWTVEGQQPAKPAVGAVVTYYINPGPYAQVMAVTSTDGQGRYSFVGMPVGAFMIMAQANTRDFKTETGVNPGLEDLQVNLSVEIPPVTALGTIEGEVVMPDGSPAEGVIVTSGAGSVLSGPLGSFVLPVVPQLSAHVVNATTRDRKRTGQTTATVTVGGDRATGVRIVLSSLGAAEFTVLDMTGSALAGLSVKLLDSKVDPCGRSTAVTDSSGRAAFSSLGVGAVTAQVVHEGEIMDAARATVSVTGEGSTGFGILRVETRGSTIAGVVNDRDGQPVLGAEVELRSLAFVRDISFCGMQQTVTHRARTGADGRFRFTGVHPGRVYLTATEPTFAPTPVTVTQDLVPGASVEVTLSLVSTIAGRISGVVYEPDGETIAGPGVEVTMNGPLPDVTVFTNAQGEYRFAEIFPQGSYTITARDPLTGLVEQGRIFAAASVPLTHDIRLKGKATVRVRVETANAEAVTNAYVTLREAAYPRRVFEGVLDASSQGRVDFPGVFEGQVSIEVRDPLGRNGGRNALTIPTGTALVETTVRVTTTGTVRGRFLHPVGDDSPIPYGSVRLLVGGRLIGQVTTSATDPVGGYEFGYVPAGAFRLEGLDPLTGRTGLAAGTIDAEGEIVQVDMRAQAIGTVTGFVTENGSPRGGSRVELTSGGYSATTTSDAFGKYLVQGVPEGKVVVSADLGTGAITFLRGTVSGNLVGEGTTLELNVALRDSGRVTGTVLKAGTGTEGAGVTAISISVGGAGGGVVTGSTDENGNFEFTRVPSGLATLTAEALGSDDFASGTVDVPAGGDAEPVTLRLNGIGSLRGVGHDSLGAPVRGSVTIAYGPAGRRRGVTLETSASDGSFLLPRVLAGPFTATLRVMNGSLALYGTASGIIEDGKTNDVVVELQDSATVTGRVLRADGLTPAYGAAVTLNLTGTSSSTSAQAQADGRFTFRGVSLAAFSVRVSDPVTGGLAQASGRPTTNGEVLDLHDLVLDDSPVRVLSVSPADGAVDVSVMQPLSLTFSDPLAGTTGLSVRDGSVGVTTSLPVLSNDNRTATFNPPAAGWPNPKTLTILATTAVTDSLGRHPAETFSSRFTTEDKTPPHAVTFSPASGALQVAPAAAIEITFSEPLSLPPAALEGVIRLYRTGAGQVTGSSSLVSPTMVRFVPAAPLPENASYSVFVTGAIDLLGNVQTQTQVSSFSSLDTVPPVLNLTAPAPNSAVRNRRPTISVSAVDSLAGFDAAAPVVLTLDGAPVPAVKTVNGFHHVPSADLAEGTHQVFAQAQDRAGNLATLASAFIVDVSAPSSVSLVTPAANQTISGTITLAASAADALSAIQRIEVVEGPTTRATLFAPSLTASFDTRILAEGFHTLFPRAYDAPGNSADGPPITVLVDNTPLVVTITQPAQGARVRSSVTVTAQVSEPVQGVEFATPGLAAVSIPAPGPYTTTLDLSGVPESDSITIQATATASQGGTSSATRVIAVDRTPPAPVVAARVVAAARAGSSVQIVGGAGAGEAGSAVEIRSPRGDVRLAPVAADGSFVSSIPGAIGDVLRLAQFDPAGNGGEAIEVPVTAAPALEGVPTEGLRMWVSADTIPYDAAEPSGWNGVWADASAVPNNALQATPSARPLLVTSAPAFGGLPVLRFDGSSDFLRFNSIGNIQTVFWVLQDNSGDTSSHYLLSNFSGPPLDFAPGASGEAIWSTSASAAVTGGQTWVNGVPVKGTASGRPRQASIVSVVTTGDTRADTFGTYIGITQFFKGDLAEMLIYSRALNGEERQSVEDYLARKYRPYTPRVSAPRVSPPGAVLDGPTSVQINTDTPEAVVHFTLDGTTPTRLSPEYSGPFVVEATTIVKAVAFRDFFEDSAISTASFIRSEDGPIRDANLSLWVRADAGVGRSAGSYLPVWTDQSGQGNHLVQQNGAALPQHVPEASNRLPALRFDGSSDYFNFTMPMADIRTVFFVARESDSATGSYRYLLGDTPSSYPFASGAATLWEPTNTAAAVKQGDTYINGAPVDGTQTARPRDLSVISVVTNANVPARLLGSYNGAMQFWWGDMSEVLIYNRALSPAERRAVEAYLGARYSIAPAAASSGSVQVDVKRAGVSQSGVAVTLVSDSIAAAPADNLRTVTTNASGRATAAMPVGFLTAKVTDRDVVYEATGTLRVAGGLTLAINLPALPTAIRGRVVASDGVTPLPGVTVSAGAKQSVTDPNGEYRIDSPTTGSATVGFSFQGLSDSVTTTIPSGSETVLNHTQTRAPVHLVRVTENGTGLPMPGVSITVCSTSLPPTCAPSRATDALGRVQYLGQPTGSAADAGWHNVTAVAEDGATLTRSGYFHYSAPGGADLAFEPPGRVHGAIRLPGGLPAAGVNVWLSDLSGGASAAQVTGADGTYSFVRLGGHDVIVGATAADDLVEATAAATIPVGGDVIVDLTLPVAILDVSLVDGAGQPFPDQPVTITAVGPRTLNRTSDAQGRVRVTLPAGFTQVVAWSSDLAAAEFDLALGETRSVTLTAGSHHGPRAIGDFNVTGSSDGSIYPAQFDMYSINSSGVFLSAETVDGRSEARLASYDGSWWNPTPVYSHQTLFVPTGGAFARSLTTFTNPSDAEITITVVAGLGAYGNASGEPGSVTVDGSYSVVFGRDAEWFCNEGCFIQSTLTLPPHGKKALLAFTTMDPALIPSLLDLSAAGAFADLSEADRAAIQNFDVPAPAQVVIEGVAQTEAGDALAGATVAVARGETVVAQGVSAADGSFSLAFSGPTGTYRVVFVLGDQLFEATLQIFASGTQSLGPLRALDSTARGSAKVRLVDGTGSSVESLGASARSTRFLGLDLPVVGSTDARGVVVLQGLLLGLNRIDTPLGPAFVRIEPGVEAPVWLQTGPGSVSASGRVTLGGAPVQGGAVVVTRYDDASGEEIVLARSTTNAGGRYTITGLPDGDASFNVYGWAPGPYSQGRNSFYTASGSPSAAVSDVELSTADQFGEVRIRAYLEPSGAKAAGHMASLRVDGAPFAFELELDGEGEGQLAGLPANTEVEVTVTGSGGFGREKAWLYDGPATPFSVVVGDRVALPKRLSGYRFDGQMVNESNGCFPFCLAAESQMLGVSLPAAGSAAQALSGRELVVTSPTTDGAGASAPVKLTRRLFVPPDGRFARVIDVFENTSTVTAAASYALSAIAYSYSGTQMEILGDGIIDPTDSAFVIRSDQPSAETTGFVLWGSNGLGPSQVSTGNLGYYEASQPRWEGVAVAPGQKVAFMSFVVFDRGAGADTVSERTQALMNLTDPLALEGLSPLDRAQVLNFALDATVTAVVEGSAQTPDGSAISGATVAIGIGDAVVAQGVTGTDGGFSLAFTGRAGAYRLVFLSGSDIFEGTVQVSASGTLSIGPLRAVPRGSARLIVEDGSGASVSSLPVSVLPTSFFGLDSEVGGSTDAQGVAVVEG